MSANGNGRTTAPPPASAMRGHRVPAPAPPIAHQRTGGSVANPPTHRVPHQSQQHRHHDPRDAHSDDSRYDEEEDGESDYENSEYGDEGGSDEEGSEYDDDDEYDGEDGGTDAEAEPVGDDEQDEVIHADADYDSATQLGKNCTNALLCQWLTQSVEVSKLAPQQKGLCAQRIVLRDRLLDYMRVNGVTRARRLFTDGKYVEVRVGDPRASSSTADGIIEKAIRKHVKPTMANECAAEVENRAKKQAEKRAKEEAKRAKKEAERALHQHALPHDAIDIDDDDDDADDGKDRPAKRPRTSPSDTLPSGTPPLGGIAHNAAPTAQSKRDGRKGPSLSDTVAELIARATRSVQEARSAARGRPSLKVTKYDKAAKPEPIVIGKEDADLAMRLPGIPGGAQIAAPPRSADVGDGKASPSPMGDPVLDAIVMDMASRKERKDASPTSAAPSVHRLSVTAARWARDFHALGEEIADLNKELRPMRARMAALTLDLAPLPGVAMEGSRAPTKAATDKRALHAHYAGLRDIVAQHIGKHPSNERGGVPWHVPPEISPAHGDYRIGVVTRVRRGTLTRARYLTLVQHAAAAVLSDSGFEATQPYSYDATGEIFATWDIRERLCAAIKAAIAQHREQAATGVRALVISRVRASD